MLLIVKHDHCQCSFSVLLPTAVVYNTIIFNPVGHDETKVSYGPAVPLLGIYSKELEEAHEEIICTSTLIAT